MTNIDNNPSHLIEVKATNGHPARGFKFFGKFFPDAQKIQLVKNLSRNKSFPDGLYIKALIPWLTHISLLE